MERAPACRYYLSSVHCTALTNAHGKYQVLPSRPVDPVQEGAAPIAQGIGSNGDTDTPLRTIRRFGRQIQVIQG